MKTSRRLLRVLGGLVAVLAVATLGFVVPPLSKPAYAEPNCSVATAEVPAGLPAPVLRYYSVLFGPTYSKRQVPVLQPAVVSGRGSLTLAGVQAPLLFQAYYGDSGRFRRAMDMTWLGIPLVPAVEESHGGVGYRKVPLETAQGPQTAQAENLSYWAEAVWMPSVFFKDPNIRWEAVDETSARLVVPLGSATDSLLVHFDAQTGLIQSMSALRYRDDRATTRSPWQVTYRDWRWFHEVQVPGQLSMSWDGEAAPAQVLTIEGVEYGVRQFLPSHPAYVHILQDTGPFQSAFGGE